MRLRLGKAPFRSSLSCWLVGVSVAFSGCGDSGSETPVDTAPGPTVTTPVAPNSTLAPSSTEPADTTPVVNPPPTTTDVTPPTDTTPVDSTATVPATSSSPTEPTPTASTTDTTSEPSTSPSTEPTAATWEVSGSTWSIALGDSLFEVDASTGARVTGYSLGATQVMVPSSAVSGDNSNNYGSTFTLAPQSASGWPPPVHLDTAAYTGGAEGAVLTLASEDRAGNDPRIQVTKVFTADAANQTITIDYQVTNTGGTSVSWAPWQITRVPRNGVTFFPTGSGVCSGCPAELTITPAGDYSFWKYDASDVGTADDNGNEWGDKFTGDGTRGWLAHAHSNTLLLLQFEDVLSSSFAPNDGEIAIYASAQDPYVEIEPQGAYAPIAAGATLSWKVKWSLHLIPQSVAVQPGEALGDFADTLATQLGGL